MGATSDRVLRIPLLGGRGGEVVTGWVYSGGDHGGDVQVRVEPTPKVGEGGWTGEPRQHKTPVLKPERHRPGHQPGRRRWGECGFVYRKCMPDCFTPVAPGVEDGPIGRSYPEDPICTSSDHRRCHLLLPLRDGSGGPVSPSPPLHHSAAWGILYLSPKCSTSALRTPALSFTAFCTIGGSSPNFISPLSTLRRPE